MKDNRSVESLRNLFKNIKITVRSPDNHQIVIFPRQLFKNIFVICFENIFISLKIQKFENFFRKKIIHRKIHGTLHQFMEICRNFCVRVEFYVGNFFQFTALLIVNENSHNRIPIRHLHKFFEL